MASRPDRPYSAKSRLESARPLNTSPPVSRLLARSQSQSTAHATGYQSSIARAQALDDSAKTHYSPSKTRSLRHDEARPESASQRRNVSLSFTILLVVLLLLFWQILVAIILSVSLHSAQQLNNQIAVQGAFGALLPPDGNWTLTLQDMRLSMNVTSRGNSRKDIFALQSMNSTFIRTTSITISGSIRSVSSSAAGTWTIVGANTLILNVTTCGGDTVYSCVSSDATTSYSLSEKGNSMVVLTDSDGSSALTYAYQPGLPQ
ncbi:hypothetical protein WJX77_001477 [Trebouxia sp. C0004]